MNHSVHRVYVEKKPDYNIEARNMLNDIVENLGIKVSGLRIVHCYDVEGLPAELMGVCKAGIFAEANVDDILEGIQEQHAFVLGRRLLPGQFDQRADSASQCIQIMTGFLPTVWYTKYHIIEGSLSDEDCEKIQRHIINPIDSMAVGLEKPQSLSIDAPRPKDIESVGLIELPKNELIKLHSELSLAMTEADLEFVQAYFRDTEKRNPTITELKVIDTYWSDHCRHTTFLTEIDKIDFAPGKYAELMAGIQNSYEATRKSINSKSPISLMNLATIAAKALKAEGKLDNLDESEEINAASIIIDVDVDGTNEEWLLMFKNETHNHPTEMEPFGGAATCLGGAIRDPLSGRAYVYQAMRITGAADPTTPISETMAGKLPQRTITKGAAQGYSSYGNQMGLATGLVSEVYHPLFAAKRMEIGAVVGAVKRDLVVRERPKPGDVVILVGGRTGRDGIGGATGSSKDHSGESLSVCGAEVQKGNPPTERKLMRLFRKPEVIRLILRCNDFGAGGVSVAIGELADSLEIDLDAILKKYDGLDGTELAISESQERMAVVVSVENSNQFISYASNENLEAYVVAEVTDSGRLIMNWRGKSIVDISREFLNTSGITQKTSVSVDTNSDPITPIPHELNLRAQWLRHLSDLNIASQKGLIEMFDATVGSNTVLNPLGGKYLLTPAQAMAAKIPVLGETTTASLMAYGYNPYIAENNPFFGALYAVVESISKLVATGARYSDIRLSLQEYFEKLTDAESWGRPYSALLGAYLAQMELGAAAIGGKDSMSGTFKSGKINMSVPPTLVSFAIAPVNTKNIISPEFKRQDSHILLLHTPINGENIPIFDALKHNYELIHSLIMDGSLLSCHTLEHGICAALSKMAFGNKIGASIDFGGNLFEYRPGAFLLEIADLPQGLLENDHISLIGHTRSDAELKINGERLQLEECI